MTVSETYTAIGDAIRRQYGTTDKYKLADMPTLIDNLEVKNLLEAGQTFEATVTGGWINQPIKGMTVDLWNQMLVGKAVTLSCDAEWSNYQPGIAAGDRFFMEFYTTTTDGTPHWNGLYVTPTTDSGKQKFTATFKASDLPIKTINDAVIYDELNAGSTLKLSNIKMTVNPVGG